MKKFLADLIKRLSSRKFLLAVSAGAFLAANQQWTEFVAVVVAYIGSEGIGDAAERYQEEKTAQTENLLKNTQTELGILDTPDGSIDRGNVVAGNDIPMQ